MIHLKCQSTTTNVLTEIKEKSPICGGKNNNLRLSTSKIRKQLHWNKWLCRIFAGLSNLDRPAIILQSFIPVHSLATSENYSCQTPTKGPAKSPTVNRGNNLC